MDAGRSAEKVPKQKLLGEAPNGLYRAQAIGGTVVEPGEVIFPILTQDPSGDLQSIGTGFFIAENGIFVTAKHVAMSVFGSDGVPSQPLIILQFGADNIVYPRPINRVTHHQIADVAVGVAWPMHHNASGQALPNARLTLSGTPPPVGRRVATYGYPKTKIVHGKPQKVYLEPAFFEGELIEYFPAGRDSVFLPGSCFQTSMAIHGGASGGPVVGQDGRVFGINSTGFEEDFVSFVSPVVEILDLAIPGVALPGSPEARVVTVRELRDLGFVALD